MRRRAKPAGMNPQHGPLGALLLAAIFDTAAVIAQTPIPQDPSAQASDGLQEVIVTAERHAENAQEVPLSIVPFNPSDLKELGISEAFDLANQVPNMNVDAPTADSTVRYFIRGVGTQDFNTLATSPIALYLDDVYLGSTIANSVNLYDLQQVEVLLGPQGTLWGKNSTGGAISFISAHPVTSYLVNVSGGYGNLGERFAQAVMNVPFTSALAARLALMYSGRNAWIKNLAPDGPHNLDAYEKVGVRLSFEWRSSDALTAYLKGEYLKRSGSTITGHMVPLRGTTDAFGNPALPLGIVNQAPGPSSDDFETWDVTVRVDYSLGHWATLSSITAWLNADRIHEYELNGGTPFLILNQAFFGDHDQFTQELRALSAGTGPLRWQGGLLYYFAREGAVTAAPYNQGVFGGSPGFITADLWPESRKYNSDSAYGGLEYDLDQRITLKGGLRYNYDEGSYHAQHYAIYPYVNYLNYLNPNPAADPNSILVPADAINTSMHWNKLTWDTGLRLQLSDHRMIYFNASTGYRQGTFSSPSGNSPQTFSTLQPETNLAFEAGAKTAWLNNRLELNAAVFSYSYTDMQVFVLQPITYGAPLAIERNAGAASDRGGELEVRSVPSTPWLITADLGYARAAFTRFDTTNAMDMPVSLAGNRIPRQPQWTASTRVQYQLALPAERALMLQTDWNYRGDYYVNADNLNNPYIPGRVIGNISAALTPMSQRWQVAVWVRNLTDKHYPMGGYRLGVADSDILYFGDPITYGISASISLVGQ